MVRTLEEKQLLCDGMNTYKEQVLNKLTEKGVLNADVSLVLLDVAREFVNQIYG